MLWTTQDMAGDEMQREKSTLNVLSQSGQMLATAILAAAAAAATASVASNIRRPAWPCN